MSIWTKTSSGWVEIGGGSDGLEGLGNWAVISEVSGSPKRYAYNDGSVDWVAFEWTVDGSLTTQAGGLVQALLCGSGGCEWANGVSAGAHILAGAYTLPSGALPVTVGQPKGGANAVGDPSAVEGGAALWVRGGNAYDATKPGAGPGSSGIVSKITGSDVEYCSGGGQPSKTGPGSGNPAGGQYSQRGTVIVSVPAEQAAGVDPGSWVTRIDYYAEVTDGTVTDLYQERFYGDDTVRTENGRYASPEQPDDLIPCDPSVAEGWTYADGEFTPPPPDPSWREEAIEALKQQLKDLQKDT